MTANTEKTAKTVKAAKPMKVATPMERLGISVLRLRLGASLQKHRLARGMTQQELADFADLSLKYVGEIERGDANTTLEVLERLAAAVGWNLMETLEGLHESLSEGVRVLLLEEVHQMLDHLRHMSKWLQALDPALIPKIPPPPGAAQADVPPEAPPAEPVRLGRRPPRASRRARRLLNEHFQQQELERLQQQREEPEPQTEPGPEPEPPPKEPD